MAASTKGLDIAWALARIGTGLIMAYHGSQKAFGAFGGSGFAATLEGFEAGMGIPPFLAVCAIAGELLGGLGLVVGALTRIAGFGVMVTMVVAMFVNIGKAENGFMTALMTGDREIMSNVEFTFLMALVGLGAVLGGAGKYSVDHKLNLEQKIPFLKPKE